MKILEVVSEQSMEKLCLIPGRYQPPHIGHLKAWEWLEHKFDKAMIVTSNKVEQPRSPFNFQEKKALLMHAGVPQDSIVQVKSPYRANEIVDTKDPERTILIFAVSKKDMENDRRFSFAAKKDGSPSYFQPYSSNKSSLQPLSKHGYIVTVPTFKFNVLDNPMQSASELRAQFAQADDNAQAKLIKGLYGSYSDEIHNLMKAKIV